MLLHFLETECTTEQRTQFLRFATGRIALSGQESPGWLSVLVVGSWSPDRLPEPHTCIPRMELAPHVSQQQLNSKMRQVGTLRELRAFCFVTRHRSGDCRDSWRRYVCHIVWRSGQTGCAAEQKQFQHLAHMGASFGVCGKDILLRHFVQGLHVRHKCTEAQTEMLWRATRFTAE